MRQIKIKEIREIKGEKRKLFFLIKKELFSNTLLTPEEINKETIVKVKDLTDSIFTEIEKNIFLPYFWEYARYTDLLKMEIQKIMLSSEFNKLPNIILKRNELNKKIMDLAKSIYVKSVKKEYIFDIIKEPTLSQYAEINRKIN